jgi:hypothetical protein
MQFCRFSGLRLLFISCVDIEILHTCKCTEAKHCVQSTALQGRAAQPRETAKQEWARKHIEQNYLRLVSQEVSKLCGLCGFASAVQALEHKQTASSRVVCWICVSVCSDISTRRQHHLNVPGIQRGEHARSTALKGQMNI